MDYTEKAWRPYGVRVSTYACPASRSMCGRVGRRAQDGQKATHLPVFRPPPPIIPCPQDFRARLSRLSSFSRYPLGPRPLLSTIGRAHTAQPACAGGNGRDDAIITLGIKKKRRLKTQGKPHPACIHTRSPARCPRTSNAGWIGDKLPRIPAGKTCI